MPRQKKITIPEKRGAEKITEENFQNNKEDNSTQISETWPQKTIRLDKKLFDLVGSVAKSLGMRDHEFCTMALRNEVKRHNKKTQESLLKKIEELKSLETSM